MENLAPELIHAIFEAIFSDEVSPSNDFLALIRTNRYIYSIFFAKKLYYFHCLTKGRPNFQEAQLYLAIKDLKKWTPQEDLKDEDSTVTKIFRSVLKPSKAEIQACNSEYYENLARTYTLIHRICGQAPHILDDSAEAENRFATLVYVKLDKIIVSKFRDSSFLKDFFKTLHGADYRYPWWGQGMTFLNLLEGQMGDTAIRLGRKHGRVLGHCYGDASKSLVVEGSMEDMAALWLWNGEDVAEVFMLLAKHGAVVSDGRMSILKKAGNWISKTIL